MKTAYFMVVLLAFTFVPEHADGWLTIPTVKGWWYTSKRRLDVPNDAVDPVEDSELPTVLHDLDVNGDGFFELYEIAHVTGLKVTNPVLLARFHKADTNGDGKLDLDELQQF
ncbi:calmodulin-like protein 5 [Gigantopelta aegis]|uniref:calmodulin-like protein 5 n=1 Tax=Gigantopelta aegis TaxID=1735272 RepID=UPI001B88C7DE|nr:calmodulin-like protein 5 [Gigantopelta aegis]